MKHLLPPILSLLLIACNAEPQGGRIVLKVYRGGFLNLFNPQHVYVISTVGLGEIKANLPSGLEDQPEWSPNGEWVVFDTWFKDDARSGGQADVYLMRADGSRRVRVTDSPTTDMEPTWSPDGRRIAYAASSTISILNVECLLRGEDCHPQSVPLVRGDSPHWSPSGKQLVYQSREFPGLISVISADGSGEPIRLSSPNQHCGHPRWSPDGRRIAFDCPRNVYVINVDGSGLVNLTEGKYGGYPQWSPDGSQIAFVSSREGGRALDLEGSEHSDAIFLMNADGTNVVRLSKRDDESVIWFAWLPLERVPATPEFTAN